MNLKIDTLTKIWAVKYGLTWSAEHGEYRSHEELGADVRKAPKGWRKLFDPPTPASRRLKVVNIVYDWKLFTDGDYERKGGDF